VIDFIVAARQTDLAPWQYSFKGRDIPVEEPAEILAKKLKYRGSRIIPRDIFDILAVDRFDPAIVAAAVAAASDGARRAVDRIRRIEKRYRETIRDEVNPTATGAELLEVDPIEVAEILSGWAKA
jgi:transglutaminase-like putative cysteine protease